MTQSPVIPQIMPNLDFMEHYIDSLENLPLDVQRFVSQIREYDLLYKDKLDTMSRYLCLYQKETSGQSKRKYLNKIQRCLIKSQHYGDMKLNLISQIVDLVDSRSQELNQDVDYLNSERKDEDEKTAPTNHNVVINNRVKVEKTNKPVSEKSSSKSLYDKPKRVRRGRAVEKTSEKNDRSNNPSRASNKADEDDDDDPMEDDDDEEPEIKPRKEAKKSKDREAKIKEREKEREKSTADKEEREDKKIDRKDKNNSGKVTKKANNKLQSKIKKQKKKKEKEIIPEDIPIDPDEPTYCICNRISYGDMIGCDNESCAIEWFHFDCVNLTHKPKGKWYCPRCTTERKEKSKK